MKKIIVKLSEQSINNAIREVENLRKRIENGSKQLIKEMAEMGCQIAQVNFGKAMYDGTNDVVCRIEERGENLVAVVATGEATLFIEFGTGILWPDTHPENQFARGEYGHGLGKMAGGWRYDGDPGTNGEVITSGKHAGKVHTYGNPANACLYLSVRELEREFESIARRVFSDG